MNVKRLATDSVFLCILIISAFTNVVIPITEIAFTLQLLVVFLICYLLPLTDSMIILLAYIVMGLIGIPVFSAGGGIGYLVKPTFGYILGFVVMPIVMWLADKLPIKSDWLKSIVKGIIGLFVLYLIGTIYFCIVKNVYLNVDNKVTFVAALLACVIPFIPIDLIKMVLAIVIKRRLKVVIDKDIKWGKTTNE